MSHTMLNQTTNTATPCEEQQSVEQMRAQAATREREPICPPWCDGHAGEYQPWYKVGDGDGVERNHDSAGEKVSISCVETVAGGERSFSDPGVVVYDVDEVTMTPQQASQVGSELFKAVREIYDNQVTEVPIQRIEPRKPGPEDTGLCPSWCAEHVDLSNDETFMAEAIDHRLVLARSGPWSMVMHTITSRDNDGNVWGPEPGEVFLDCDLPREQRDRLVDALELSTDVQRLQMVADGAAAAVRALTAESGAE